MANTIAELFDRRSDAEKHQQDPYKNTLLGKNNPIAKDAMGNDVYKDGSKSYTNPYTDKTKTWQPQSYWES